MRRIAPLPTQLGITAVLATVLSFVVPISLTVMSMLRPSWTMSRIQVPRMTRP